MIKMNKMDINERESALLAVLHLLGPCSAEELRQHVNEIEFPELIRLLHDLTRKQLLVRPEIEEQFLYEVKENHGAIFMPAAIGQE